MSVKDERHALPNTIYAYDALDRLESVTQKQTIAPGADIVTAYGYDLHGNLTSVTDPNGNITSYQYDDFGRLQRQTSPVTGVTAYVYDAAGNLGSVTDANGAVTTRTYDLANRILTAASARTGVPTETVTWSWDDATVGSYGLGRIATMSDPSGMTTFRYERRGRLRREGSTSETRRILPRMATTRTGTGRASAIRRGM